MRSGDVIIRLDGERVYLSREIGLITTVRQGETLTVEYERDGERREAVLTPRLDKESGRYLLGFQGYAEYFECSPWQVFRYGYYEVRYGLKATVKSLQMLIQGKADKNEVSGPIGIAVLVDDVDVREYSLKNLRDGVGMVLQKNVLFSGTILENLRWGDADATEEKFTIPNASAAIYPTTIPINMEESFQIPFP